MNDELKSAVELALEKLDQEMGATIPALSEDQKVGIAEIRNKYRAKTAEAEISAQAEIRKLVQSGSHEAVEEAEKRLSDEKRRLHAMMEREISSIRGA